MKLYKKQSIFAQNVALLIQHIHSKVYDVTFGEAWRSAEQAAIYAREGKGIKDSLHCRRLAIDLNIFNATGVYLTDFDSYEPFGIYWESLHPLNRWGGKFKRVDCVHFEMQD